LEVLAERIRLEKTGLKRGRGVRAERIESATKRRQLQSLRPANFRGSSPHNRKGERHSKESRLLMGDANRVRAWLPLGGPPGTVVVLCVGCGKVLMTSDERLRAGKRGLFHAECANRWRSQVGRETPGILGVAARLPLPNPRFGRPSTEEGIRDYFRWFVLHRLGGMSFAELATLVSAERGTVVRGSTIQYAVEVIAGSKRFPSRLPDPGRASQCLRGYLEAFERHNPARPR
jgi:hypothetical protein